MNGLNQYVEVASAGYAPRVLTYDANGNLTGDGTTGYTYDVENRLVVASNGTELNYDPLGRLASVAKAGATTRFLYDRGSGSGAGGCQLVAEYDGADNLLRRYVHGESTDDPQVWYEGSQVTSPATSTPTTRAA